MVQVQVQYIEDSMQTAISDDDCCFTTLSAFDDFKKGTALFHVQIYEAKIINDQLS